MGALLGNISEDDLEYWIVSLESDNAHDPDLTPPDMSKHLISVLQSDCGPHLCHSSVHLLSDIGIYNGAAFLEFTCQDFSNMFALFSDQEFSSLTCKGLPYAMLCGLYLSKYKLIKDDGHIHTHAFNLSCYHANESRYNWL